MLVGMAYRLWNSTGEPNKGSFIFRFLKCLVYVSLLFSEYFLASVVLEGCTSSLI